MINIRDIVGNYRNKIYESKNLQLNDASQYLVELSALMGNVMEELNFRQGEYHRKFVELLQGTENGLKNSVAKTTILAKATIEFEKLEEVKGLRETVLEMVRALKYRCRALSDEIEVSRNL